MKETRSSVKQVQITHVNGFSADSRPDLLVEEDPLEIRIGYGPEGARRQKAISITMRTPGHDFELTMGFLFSEAIVEHPSQIRDIAYCNNVELPEEVGNVVKVELEPGLEIDLDKLERHFYTTSSCGVCGKSSIKALETMNCVVFPEDNQKWSPILIHALPGLAHDAQTVFRHTGGIHAASLFNTNGQLLCLREDVGRHNAVDKVIGAMLMAGEVPLTNKLLLVSGRAGFELVQKAIRAGIRVMAAVGAPSSLAVDLAAEYNMTLLGFVRDQRFNIYTGSSRISVPVS